MRNIETKVSLGDKQFPLASLRNLGARQRAVFQQTDTYYTVPTGRLKIRETEGEPLSELIFYSRPDIEKPRISTYSIVRLPRGESRNVKRLLADAFGICAIIKKRRRLFLYGRTRIHVDYVEKLGNFLELETAIDKSGGNIGKARQEHVRLCSALGLHQYKRVAVSYADLLRSWKTQTKQIERKS